MVRTYLFSFPLRVLNNRVSLYTATKDIGCVNEKKKNKAGGERCSIPMPVFNQSFVFEMAQSEQPDRKRAQFLKFDGDFLEKLRFESVPAATKGSSRRELSSCFGDHLAGHAKLS